MSTVWENKYQKSDRDYCNTSLDSLLEGIMWDRNNIPFNYTNDLFGWCLFNNGFKDVLVLGFCKGLYTDPVTLYFIDCDDGSNANEPVVLNTFIKVNGDINVSCIPSYHLELVHNSNSIHVITTYYGSFNNSNIGTSISNRVGWARGAFYTQGLLPNYEDARHPGYPIVETTLTDLSETWSICVDHTKISENGGIVFQHEIVKGIPFQWRENHRVINIYECSVVGNVFGCDWTEYTYGIPIGDNLLNIYRLLNDQYSEPTYKYSGQYMLLCGKTSQGSMLEEQVPVSPGGIIDWYSCYDTGNTHDGLPYHYQHVVIGDGWYDSEFSKSRVHGSLVKYDLINRTFTYTFDMTPAEISALPSQGTYDGDMENAIVSNSIMVFKNAPFVVSGVTTYKGLQCIDIISLERVWTSLISDKYLTYGKIIPNTNYTIWEVPSTSDTLVVSITNGSLVCTKTGVISCLGYPYNNDAILIGYDQANGRTVSTGVINEYPGLTWSILGSYPPEGTFSSDFISGNSIITKLGESRFLLPENMAFLASGIVSLLTYGEGPTIEPEEEEGDYIYNTRILRINGGLSSFTVISTDPINGAINIRVNKRPFTVTFSEKPKESTITNTNIIINKDSTNPPELWWEWDIQTNAIATLFNLKFPLLYNTIYQGTVKSGALGVVSNIGSIALAADYTWHFLTEPEPPPQEIPGKGGSTWYLRRRRRRWRVIRRYGRPPYIEYLSATEKGVNPDMGVFMFKGLKRS